MAIASDADALAPAVALPPMATEPVPEAAALKPKAEALALEAADSAPIAVAAAAVAFAARVASPPKADAPAPEAVAPKPTAVASVLDATELTPTAIVLIPTLAAALLPMAMPDVAAATTDDWPPMATESAAAATAPAVALPPIAVAPAPEAVTAVVPPPMATLLVPVALESSSAELAWKYFVPARLSALTVLKSCEPFTASVEAADTSPSATPWI